MPDAPARPRRSYRRLLAFALVAAAVLWVGLFDSHSVRNRVQYHRELRATQAENARLEAEIAEFDRKLAAGLSATTVEQVAREQYGMRRPGETVYRVAPAAPAE